MSLFFSQAPMNLPRARVYRPSDLGLLRIEFAAR